MRKRRRLASSRPPRWVIVVLGLGWMLAAALVIALYPLSADDHTVCAADEGDSNYGELTWELVPPGPVCTFTEQRNGFEAVEWRWRYPLGVVALGVTGALLARWASHPREPGARPTPSGGDD